MSIGLIERYSYAWLVARYGFRVCNSTADYWFRHDAKSPRWWIFGATGPWNSAAYCRPSLGWLDGTVCADLGYPVGGGGCHCAFQGIYRHVEATNPVKL